MTVAVGRLLHTDPVGVGAQTHSPPGFCIAGDEISEKTAVTRG